MTRKEYFKYAKIFLLSLIVSVPILIALNLLISSHLAYWVLITVNVVVLITCFVLGVVIDEKHTKYIARKREEWVKNHPEEQEEQNVTIKKNKKHK